MFDERTEKNIASLDPKAQIIFREFTAAAKQKAKEFGCDYVAISGNRTWRQQDALYAIGRTLPGRKVTNAKGGQSNHNFGIALDYGVFRMGKYLDESEPRVASSVHSAVAKLAKQFGLEWGGDWKSIKDEPHFEVSTGLTIAEKRVRYLKNGTVF